MLKKCSKCGVNKDTDQFAKREKGYLRAYCRECDNICRAKLRAKHKRRGSIVTPEIKACPVCKEEKSANLFSPDKGNYDGLADRCKECNNDNSKRCRKRNRRIKSDLTHKKCLVCKYTKLVELFQRDYGNSSGYSPYCRECKNKKNRECNLDKSKRDFSRRKRRALRYNLNEVFAQEDKDLVMEVTGGECMRCGTKNNLCVDHFRPLSKGNPLSVLNATILCRSCNSSKCNQNPEDFFTNEEYQDILVSMSVASVLKNGVY